MSDDYAPASASAPAAAPAPRKRGLISRIIRALIKLVVALVVVFAIVWIFFLNSIVTHQVKSRTGFDLKIQKLSVNPFTGAAQIDGLLLTNPAGEFKMPGFVDLTALHADVSLRSLLFGDQIVVNSATLDLPAVTLVRRASGPSNAELFAQRLADSLGGAGSTATQPQSAPKPADTPSKPLNFLIKKLDINLGKVVIASEPANGEPTSKDYVINYKHSYENITDPKQFLTLDLAKSLLGIGSQLSDLIPGKFGDSVNSVLKGGINALDNPAQAVGGAVQGLLNKIAPKK